MRSNKVKEEKSKGYYENRRNKGRKDVKGERRFTGPMTRDDEIRYRRDEKKPDDRRSLSTRREKA